MTKKTKLKICDWSLLFLTIAILVSGLQLEISPNGRVMWVWIHIVLGTVFTGVVLWHIQLHHNRVAKKQSKSRFHSNKHPFLVILFFLMLISGIVATGHWVGTYIHSTIGGVHGKFGFLFIITIMGHVWRNRRFYR